jgi:hypothetical protein
MNDREAIAALVSDLHWQIDQLPRRGIKDNAGNPYNPSYYKRGLQNAIDRGGLVVAAYVTGYVYKPPSDGYQKLERPIRSTWPARPWLPTRTSPTRICSPRPIARQPRSGWSP